MNQFKFKNLIWSTGDEKDKVTTPCLHSLLGVKYFKAKVIKC